MLSTMCWIMCEDSSVSSYVPRPDIVTRAIEPSPGPTNSTVRPAGHRSPRACSRCTPYRYRPAARIRTSASSGSSRASVTSEPPVNGGRAAQPGVAIPAGYAGPGGMPRAAPGNTGRKNGHPDECGSGPRAIMTGEGIKINSDGYGSVFYLTTGFHGLHVTGGLLAFIFYMIRTALGRFTPSQATAAIVVSYYWHFVDIVWVALFSMIYLLK